jgi:pimeloyl-ACP methyl ester carboxylesterase
VFSNPGDEAATIPAVGFNIAATLTRPKGGAARAPAVVLVTGPGIPDRDGFALGIPTIGQLAGALADAGILSIRYDKRGTGQSGGRSESATLQDYAEDARAIVRWLSDRKDIDPKRIALVGHGEGAWIAMLTATRERRIAGLISIAGPSGSGADVILEQQQRALDVLKLAPAERDQRVALQKQILSAVATGKGWGTVPPALRKQADTPWLQSFLTFNLTRVIEDLRQPILFVHGELDRQVPVTHATQLSDLARKESRSPSIEVVVVRGVNHLLVPATTGDIAEYATLTDRNVSADVKAAVTSWLTKTFSVVK